MLEKALAFLSNSLIMQLYGSFQNLQQGDDLITWFMQRAKTLFDEFAAIGQLISLEDFNLHVFRGLRGEFKDLVTSLVTKAKPLSYVDLHSYFLTYEFLHKTALQSMRSTVINAPLLPTPNTPLLALVVHHQPFRNFGRKKVGFMKDGAPTMIVAEGIGLLLLGLIFAASMDLPTLKGGRAISIETGGILHPHIGLIYVANYTNLLAIQLLTVLNFSTMDMDNNLVQIWR